MTGIEALALQIETQAQTNGSSIHIVFATADGFGLTHARTLEVAGESPSSLVRIWEEGGSDYWIEASGETATWWRQGLDNIKLAEVVVALVAGHFSVDAHRLVVQLPGRTPFALPNRM